YRDALEELVRRRNRGDRVRFFGPIPNPESLHWTASADGGLSDSVNASLSNYPPAPNTPFAYTMAEGPVVESDCPGIGKVVRETGVGEVVDPVDPADLAAATMKILSDPEPYRSACRKARQRYNWRVESQKLLEVYARLGVSR